MLDAEGLKRWVGPELDGMKPCARRQRAKAPHARGSRNRPMIPHARGRVATRTVQVMPELIRTPAGAS